MIHDCYYSMVPPPARGARTRRESSHLLEIQRINKGTTMYAAKATEQKTEKGKMGNNVNGTAVKGAAWSAPARARPVSATRAGTSRSVTPARAAATTNAARWVRSNALRMAAPCSPVSTTIATPAWSGRRRWPAQAEAVRMASAGPALQPARQRPAEIRMAVVEPARSAVDAARMSVARGTRSAAATRA